MSLVVSKNLSANCFSNSFALESEEKSLKIQTTCLKSRLQIKKNKKSERHQKTRKGEKTYNCGLCDNFFSTVHDLKRHLRVHTGEKPFKCDVCDKTFSQAASLNTHQRMHTGEKPFKCDVCDQIFSQAATLKTHQRVHTGEKPFQCDECDKTFSLVHNLNTHKRVRIKHIIQMINLLNEMYVTKPFLFEYFGNAAKNTYM
ncbi:zinc finger protein 271-like [Artemia franciscana]|uniref:zinc finger protein 271-like n=1 Tax=Artemia franciscana TaxID=6661 RepID=UPI0032D9CB26